VPKDMVQNNFPISGGLGEGSVVPLREVVVEGDLHGGFVVGGVLATGFIDLVEEAHGHFQAGGGFGTLDELLGDLDAVEDHALARAGDVREDAMFDRVVFRAVGRVVRDADLDADAVRQSLQILFEQILRRAVAASAVAFDHEAFGLRMGRAALLFPPQSDAVAAQLGGVVRRVEMDPGPVPRDVIDAVRDQLALACAGEVMVEGLDGLLREGHAGTMEITEQFLLLRVNADHGIARRCVLLPQLRDVFELRIAIGMMAHRLLLASRATTDSHLFEQPPNHPSTGRRAPRDEPPRELIQRQVRPQHPLAHRVARCEFGQQISEILCERRPRHR
jgi:hypothetical protein